jgi:hypothetical protein
MYMSKRKIFFVLGKGKRKSHQFYCMFTHVHKITNVPVLYIENTHNDFDVVHSCPWFYSYLYAHTATTKPLLPIQQISVRMRGG